MPDRTDDGNPQPVPFDSVFKNIMERMGPLLLPLLNSLFGKKFKGQERVEYGTTEMVERRTDGKLRTIRADSHITVIEPGGTRHMFHIEAQTGYDNQIVLRFFEYDMQMALQGSVKEEDGTGFPVPESAVIYLRPAGRGAKNPKYWLFEPATGERLFEREIKALYVAKLTVDQIFAEQLYALLPFYLFTYGNRLSGMEKSEEGREELLREAKEIADRIANEGALTGEQQWRLMELIGVVAREVLKSEDTAKEIGNIMQAHVLELNVDRMLDAKWMDGKAEGKAQGIVEGKAQGIAEGKAQGIVEGKAQGIAEGKAQGIVEGKVEGKVELLVQMGQRSGQSDDEIVKNVAHFLETDEQQARKLFEQYLEEERNTSK